MAAPVIETSSTSDGSNVFTKPASLADGDVIYIFTNHFGTALTAGNKPGAPSGFTEIYWQAGSASFDPSVGCYRKIITNAAGEGASYTVADPGDASGYYIAGYIVRVSGAHQTTPEDDSGATYTTADPATTGNNITTSQADALLFVNCTNQQTTSPGTPTGMTDVANLDGGDSHTYAQTLSAQLTGAARTSSMGGTNGASIGFVAIKPPAGAVTLRNLTVLGAGV